jgi:hypothetical protein
VQLTPKSVFIGLVAFGLPIAVAVGWNLAGPARQPITATPNGGTGGIGAAAPAQGAGNGEPVPVRYSAQPNRPPATPPSTIVSVPASVTAPSTAVRPPSATPPVPTPSDSALPLPPLDQPPVPTPTEITEVPGPSTSSSADPSGAPTPQP